MMDLAHQRGPSLWGALIWKDFQQVKQTFVAVLVGVFCVQCICLFAGSFMQEKSQRLGLYGCTVTFACVAPILLALGCSGMLIGQERQSGTWAWSSSLPVTWYQALCSKLLVSMVGSLVATLPLLIIPIGLLLTRRLDTGVNSVAGIHASWLTAAIFVEVILFCFFTTALIRETLTALVVAGIGITIAQILVSSYSFDSFGLPVSNGITEARLVYFYCVTFFIGVVLMTITFRWRWGNGQQATIGFVRNSLPSKPFAIANSQPASGTAPNEWWMMIRHSFANSFWLRIVVLLGLHTIMMCLISLPWNHTYVSFVAVGIFGITSFEGDHTLNRFRFLADRGVVPWKLVLCRLSVAAMFAIVWVIAIPMVNLTFVGKPDPFGVVDWKSVGWGCPAVFSVGAFASMCFRKSIVALTATLVISVFCLVISMVCLHWVHTLGDRVEYGWVPLSNVVGYSSPSAPLAILIAILVLARRWLVLDNARLAPHFLWISVASLLSPLVLACNFGFLLVPNLPWRETPTESRPPGRKVLPEILSFSHPLLNDSIELDDYPRIFSTLFGDLQKDWTSMQDKTASIELLLDPIEEALETGQRPTGVEFQYNHYARSLCFMIVRTAGLASICLQAKQPKIAKRLLRVNRELQELSYGFDPLVMLPSRYTAMMMLENMTEVEVAEIGGPDEFKSLIPSAPSDGDALLHHRWVEANSDRNRLRSSFFGYLPPLRWRIERQLAMSVDLKEKAFQSLPRHRQYLECRQRLLMRYP